MKKNFYSFLKIFLITFLLSNLCFSFIYGEEEKIPTSLEAPLPGLPKEVSGLKEYVKGLVNFSIGVAGLILFSVFIYGAFLYLLSAGDPEKKEEGKRKMKQGIIGVSLLLLLYLIHYTLFAKATVYVPSPPKVRPTSLASGIYICKDKVTSLNKYFNKNTATEAMREIREKCRNFPQRFLTVKSEPEKGEKAENLDFVPKFIFNLPSNPWGKTHEYESMVIIGDSYGAEKSSSLTEFGSLIKGYRIGKIKKIIKFEKGEIDFPSDGDSIVILKKNENPSLKGEVVLYLCHDGWRREAKEGSFQGCPEKVQEKFKKGGGVLGYWFSANSDFQEITQIPKEDDFDFSEETLSLEVSPGITAIFCNEEEKCTLIEGGTRANIEEFKDLHYSTPMGSVSKIKKIYIIKGEI